MAEQSDLAAVCLDPCDLLAWSPVTVATADAAHRPIVAGTLLFILDEPPFTAGELMRKKGQQSRQVMYNCESDLQIFI